ncbi:MAG TPA: DNA methyltransferase [Terriglobales bacterium]|nr:DNA methyltransferase [Terriglobales bacterium]
MKSFPRPCDAANENEPELQVTYISLSSLREYENNPRTHSKSQIRKIAESIRSFGFNNPILVDHKGTIIAGHGRYRAAKSLGIEEIPTIRLSSLTPSQIKAYVLADNRLALESNWDKDILRIEFQHLIADDEVDISLTGFEVAEIDVILDPKHSEPDKEDDLPALPDRAITKSGDLWLVGSHCILCGDARDANGFARLMEDRRAKVVFVDPPYNVVIDGHATGNGKIHHAEFAMASGEMSRTEFTEFLKTCLSQLAAWSTDGSVHFICMDWRHIEELMAAGGAVYSKLLNMCVWAKGVGGMGSFYKSAHELIFVYRNGKAIHRNNVQLGRFGRNRTNVWNYPGANALSRMRGEENVLTMHPTVKPIALVADALLDCSARGEIVLDSFLGSGTTLLAAERVGRICYALEIEPRYVDLAIRRWQKQTGEQAIHAVTGKAFDQMAEEDLADAR